MKFAEECAKSGGELCPVCGSDNVERWEKSRNYWGICCQADGCPTCGDGIVIHEKKITTIVGIETSNEFWEKK